MYQSSYWTKNTSQVKRASSLPGQNSISVFFFAVVLPSAAVLCSSARARGGVDGHVRICRDEVTVLRCKRLLPRAKGVKVSLGRGDKEDELVV